MTSHVEQAYEKVSKTDTFLTNMKLSNDERTDKKVKLTSWKGPFDPSIGSFSAGIDHLNIPEVFIWNNNCPYWRTGPWNGRIFIGVPNMNSANAMDLILL